ncbi:BZ3500_MvSof-1268-A1-R1_Chr10-1g02707 [Microbotryum saponariae]|uniref:BZ3500_MvSof-1268-A1-R1_Chr10-1g02707 protein n=1 Tax=Microbotryum saponariae TaxID=289078 RepID=A0A2X0L781_9BASI|nr:BZ3500_MvSof-1268-A1-R1_Chr10-1g02707 [Microbotryum saponariae]SDA06196.1 BZ3501_MvSof-1269-A2-R1_Chr10-1g02308 [Microbotryum saponariae]
MRATLLFLAICCLIVSTLSKKLPPGAMRKNPGRDCKKSCDVHSEKDIAQREACYANCSVDKTPCKRVTILGKCLKKCADDGIYVFNPPGESSQQMTTCVDGDNNKSCCIQGCCTIAELVEETA